MDHAKAIRVARALVDISQRELASRISMDPSLISMLESGKRTPSLATLQKISEALGLPFHLFALLGAEPRGKGPIASEEIHQLAVALAKLLLQGGKYGPGRTRGDRSRKVRHS